MTDRNPETKLMENGSENGSWTVCAFGFVVRVSSPDRALLAEAIDYLPPGWELSRIADPDRHYELRLDLSEKDPTYRLLVDGYESVRTPSRTTLLWYFESGLRYFIAKNASDRIFVHAAALAWRGKVILLPGRSEAGKSTLALALTKVGAVYFSDEYAVIDALGLVHPYRCPLRLKGSAGGRRIRPSGLLEGLATDGSDEPLPVGWVGFTHYLAGATWSPRAVSQGQSIVRAMQFTIATQHRPAHTLRYLRAACERSIGFDSPRGEAEATAGHLLAFLDRTDTRE